MENRERDRVSQRTEPTEAGKINREVSEEKGREQNSGTTAEFGQTIGRAENLSEGGEMHNKNDKSSNMENESTRRSGSEGLGSSSGRSGNMNRGESSDKSPGRGGSGTLNSTGTSEGRH